MNSHPIKLKFGDEIEIDGRQYEIVPDPELGATLEPAITTTVDEIVRRTGGRPLTPAEFEEDFGDLEGDDEG